MAGQRTRRWESAWRELEWERAIRGIRVDTIAFCPSFQNIILCLATWIHHSGFGRTFIIRLIRVRAVAVITQYLFTMSIQILCTFSSIWSTICVRSVSALIWPVIGAVRKRQCYGKPGNQQWVIWGQTMSSRSHLTILSSSPFSSPLPIPHLSHQLLPPFSNLYEINSFILFSNRVGFIMLAIFGQSVCFFSWPFSAKYSIVCLRDDLLIDCDENSPISHSLFCFKNALICLMDFVLVFVLTAFVSSIL